VSHSAAAAGSTHQGDDPVPDLGRHPWRYLDRARAVPAAVRRQGRDHRGNLYGRSLLRGRPGSVTGRHRTLARLRRPIATEL